MGCLIALFAVIGPRFALAFVWISTGLVDRAYDEAWVPVLGFVFLPWTTLVYALAHDGDGLSALGWLFVAVALLADIGSYGAAGRGRRRPPARSTAAY